jgi:hypothetical protein
VVSRRPFELAHHFKCFIAFIDLVHREVAQPFEAECFHAKARQHAAVDHCFAEVGEAHLLHVPGQITGHAAGERVPCPGRIVNVEKSPVLTSDAGAQNKSAICHMKSIGVGVTSLLRENLRQSASRADLIDERSNQSMRAPNRCRSRTWRITHGPRR